MNLTKKNIFFAIGIFVFALLITADRYYFAQVTQWREDQATNLWLGFQAFNHYPTVGLLSSQNIVNPNGMPLLGIIFSRLPNLLWVSTALGLFQAISFIFFAYVLLKHHLNLFIMFSLIGLSSVVLRGTGGEFWNNWIYVPFILFALAFSFSKNYFLAILFIFLLPGLYLAGPLYVIACGAVFIFANLSDFKIKAIFLPLFLVSIFVAVITWIPFFSVVSLHDLAQVSHAPILERIFIACKQVILYPNIYFVLPKLSKTMFISNFEKQAMVDVFYYLIKIILVAQFFVLITTLINHYFILKNNFLSSLKSSSFRTSIIVSLFPLICTFVAPLMGGPTYSYPPTRLDQVVVFLPSYYYSLFILPIVICNDSRVSEFLLKVTYVSAMIFIAANIINGWNYVYYAKSYNGPITAFDVPLTDKRNVVDFVANDWKKTSQSSVLQVDYDIKGPWAWVEDFGEKLEKYYSAPMVFGRSFDYEFLRIYGLSNYQEGLQHRKIGTGKYIICYTNDTTKNYSADVHYFGRLKVFITKK